MGVRAAAVVGGSGHNGWVSKSSLPAPDHAAVLREALLAADFTADGLLDRLGAPAYAALARSETVPALRATRGDTPLDTLVRLFLLQRPVAEERARAALPLAECVADGWVTRAADDGTVRAGVDVRPYGGRTARTGSSCPTSGARSAARAGSARARRVSSSESAEPPPPSPGSPSGPRSPPPSISVRAPASRRCTPPSTRAGSPPPTSTPVPWSSPGSPSPCPAPPPPTCARVPSSSRWAPTRST